MCNVLCGIGKWECSECSERENVKLRGRDLVASVYHSNSNSILLLYYPDFQTTLFVGKILIWLHFLEHTIYLFLSPTTTRQQCVASSYNILWMADHQHTTLNWWYESWVKYSFSCQFLLILLIILITLSLYDNKILFGSSPYEKEEW